MIVRDSAIPGVRIIELEPTRDDRGSFTAFFRESVARAHGMDATIRQCANSHNLGAGTIRGVHFQAGGDAESKYVRCVSGRAYDVILDLRRDSPAFLKWMAIELAAGDDRMLYVPAGCAHGFQTLTDNTELSYLLTEEFRAGRDLGVRWNDPAFGIVWPTPCTVMSDRDATYPDFVV